MMILQQDQTTGQWFVTENFFTLSRGARLFSLLISFLKIASFAARQAWVFPASWTCRHIRWLLT